MTFQQFVEGIRKRAAILRKHGILDLNDPVNNRPYKKKKSTESGETIKPLDPEDL